MPTLPGNVDSIMRHVALGTTASPYISLTRSYGVAEGYARDAGRAFPTHALPAYVYEFDISTPLPTAIVEVIDPVAEVAARNQKCSSLLQAAGEAYPFVLHGLGVARHVIEPRQARLSDYQFKPGPVSDRSVSAAGPRDAMGRAARKWQHRRCILIDGVPQCPSRTT